LHRTGVELSRQIIHVDVELLHADDDALRDVHRPGEVDVVEARHQDVGIGPAPVDRLEIHVAPAHHLGHRRHVLLHGVEIEIGDVVDLLLGLLPALDRRHGIDAVRLERAVADDDRAVARLLRIDFAGRARIGEEGLVAEREEALVLAVDADKNLVHPDDVELCGILRLVEPIEAELAGAPDRRRIEF